MATRQQVIDLHRKYPQLTSSQIAERFECLPAYVRATAQREGLTLPGSRPAKACPKPRVQSC